jgi:ribosome-associated translation inhibitor RaiA
MTNEQERLEELVADLRQQRDELLLQIHLAKAEAKEEWEELEHKWKLMEPKLEALRREATDSAQDVGAALDLVADELRKAYKRLRDTLD